MLMLAVRTLLMCSNSYFATQDIFPPLYPFAFGLYCKSLLATSSLFECIARCVMFLLSMNHWILAAGRLNEVMHVKVDTTLKTGYATDVCGRMVKEVRGTGTTTMCVNTLIKYFYLTTFTIVDLNNGALNFKRFGNCDKFQIWFNEMK